jgi:hypothetical protein
METDDHPVGSIVGNLYLIDDGSHIVFVCSSVYLWFIALLKRDSSSCMSGTIEK